MRDSWESFNDSLNDTQRSLESSRMQWSSFDENFDQLMQWVHDTESQVIVEPELKATLQEKKAQLQNLKVRAADTEHCIMDKLCSPWNCVFPFVAFDQIAFEICMIYACLPFTSLLPVYFCVAWWLRGLMTYTGLEIWNSEIPITLDDACLIWYTWKKIIFWVFFQAETKINRSVLSFCWMNIYIRIMLGSMVIFRTKCVKFINIGHNASFGLVNIEILDLLYLKSYSISNLMRLCRLRYSTAPEWENFVRGTWKQVAWNRRFTWNKSLLFFRNKVCILPSAWRILLLLWRCKRSCPL